MRRGTEGQRDRGTEGQRDRGTEVQRKERREESEERRGIEKIGLIHRLDLYWLLFWIKSGQYRKAAGPQGCSNASPIKTFGAQAKLVAQLSD